ncbi:MAG TPA: paraslipin, partial [Nitrospinaceae bacterium]|nr:paraslipin [Nitrospinaceae bacterium]
MQLIIGFLAFLAVVKGVKFVPQQQVWIVERMGRYRMSMQAGINFLIPFIDNV